MAKYAGCIKKAVEGDKELFKDCIGGKWFWAHAGFETKYYDTQEKAEDAYILEELEFSNDGLNYSAIGIV